MTYEEILQELESRGMMPERPPTLDFVRQALDRLRDREGISLDPKRVIVVAGTNGKGSVCAVLEALLLSAGQKVGLYTSPHLVEVTERIRLSGRDVVWKQFAAAYEAVVAATGDLPLTHFEMLTLMAVWTFARENVEWSILEVGLGGLWDATNAVPHQVNAITALGLDHQNLLGSTLSEIALNKFGIVGMDSVVVHSPLPAIVEPLMAETMRRTRSRWVAAPEFQVSVEEGQDPRFYVETRWGRARLALPGKRGAENAVTALALFAELGFDPSTHLDALSRVRWPGRMERLKVKGAPCLVFASGDHNPQGVQSLLEILPHYPRTHLRILAGVGKDKDCDGVLGPLFALPDATVYLTETPFRGRPLASYGEWQSRAAGAWTDPIEAFTKVLRECRPGELFLVTGSLYLVGAVKAHIPR